MKTSIHYTSARKLAGLVALVWAYAWIPHGITFANERGMEEGATTLITKIGDAHPDVTFLDAPFAKYHFRRDCLALFTNIASRIDVYASDGLIFASTFTLILTNAGVSLGELGEEQWSGAFGVRAVIRNQEGWFESVPDITAMRALREHHAGMAPSVGSRFRWKPVEAQEVRRMGLLDFGSMGFRGLPNLPAKQVAEGEIIMDCSSLYETNAIGKIKYDPSTGVIIDRRDYAEGREVYRSHLALDGVSRSSMVDRCSVIEGDIVRDAPSPDAGRIGVMLAARTNHGPYVVDSVVKGSSAFRAGLQSGDVVLKVGTRLTAEISALETAKLLKGPTGTVVEVLYSRNNRTNIVFLERRTIGVGEDVPWRGE